MRKPVRSKGDKIDFAKLSRQGHKIQRVAHPKPLPLVDEYEPLTTHFDNVNLSCLDRVKAVIADPFVIIIRRAGCIGHGDSRFWKPAHRLPSNAATHRNFRCSRTADSKRPKPPRTLNCIPPLLIQKTVFPRLPADSAIDAESRAPAAAR